MKILCAIFLFVFFAAGVSAVDLSAVTGAIYFSVFLIGCIATTISVGQLQPVHVKAVISRRKNVPRKSKIQRNDPLLI